MNKFIETEHNVTLAIYIGYTYIHKLYTFI